MSLTGIDGRCWRPAHGVASAAIALMATTLFGGLVYLSTRMERLGTKIDGLGARLDARIDSLDTSLNGRIVDVASRLDGTLDAIRRSLEPDRRDGRSVFGRPGRQTG